ARVYSKVSARLWGFSIRLPATYTPLSTMGIGQFSRSRTRQATILTIPTRHSDPWSSADERARRRRRAARSFPHVRARWRAVAQSSPGGRVPKSVDRVPLLVVWGAVRQPNVGHAPERDASERGMPRCRAPGD